MFVTLSSAICTDTIIESRARGMALHVTPCEMSIPSVAGSYVDVVACDDSLVAGVCVEGSQTGLVFIVHASIL